ncbi:hydrolase 1, exosortase A system-associated [Parasphingorhabdus cellanae]|uniref:Hydrolase 1, exosortase A system-associated n=1 Tax=Parasphingorhabdus cellanae TaxID=2806553 RepID=A0ABX7T7M6_9SPHN|nr:hydrolase 1, exosortase A system-associated [Parasphingorhabdus cellanae]QTD56459.1 hydrolase 1, exosortase A system-associated [Parasphingorhabdus cellanae]
MTRSFHQFICKDALLAGTLDKGPHPTGLLIVSGGNEIKAGAHAGMAKLAQEIASQGFPVFRYDRRGIGDSSGRNRGFLDTKADIEAAAACFRDEIPMLKKLVAFGNCDAASALALFGSDIDIDRVVLANPWVIEDADPVPQKPTKPPPSAIRSRYWQRLKNPKTILDLLTGKINFRKLAIGLKQAAQKQENTSLSIQLKDGLIRLRKPTRILLASRDTTARAFLAAWHSKDFADARALPNITNETLDSASHSFADDHSKRWLESQLLEALKNA